MPILTMGALGLILSAGLAIAYQKLKVEEDPKVVKISEALPQANCGACGYSGCRAFAEAVVKGEAETNGCPVGGEETITKVAEIMGVKADEVVKKIARILCHGDTEAAKDRGTYLGITTCYAANLTGGNKQCPYGCLGFGDCVLACPFEAIHMGGDGLPVVDGKKCTACGKCTEKCFAESLELIGKEMSVAEAIEEVLKDKEFYGNSNGGMTISGGEPMTQFHFTEALLAEAKKHDLHT